MALADFTPVTRKIPIGGKNDASMEIHGLSLTDIAALFDEYAVDFRALFDLYKEAQTKASADGADGMLFLVSMFSTFIRRAPALVAYAIALAADEPDSREQAALIAPAKQIEILTTIAELTMGEGVGLKKLIATAMSLWEGQESLMQEAETH